MTLSQRYGVYIVKIWRETAESGDVWRASVLNTLTKERNHFATRESLIRFLCPLPEGEETLPDDFNAWLRGDATP